MEDYVKIEKIGEGMYLKFRHFMYPKHLGLLRFFNLW